MALGGHPPRSRWVGITPYLPWTDGTGRCWPAWRRLPRAAPFVLLYLVVSWALFIPLAWQSGGSAIDQERVRVHLYAIPDLSVRPLAVLRALLTAPFLNHNNVQLVYVTVLLLAFGVTFEVREGTLRTALIFFATTWVGAIVAGVLLHALYPEPLDYDLLRRAWERTWSGGSAGCFGLLGAVAGRARRPLPLLLLFVLWELNVAVWYLKHYTPAFHLTALVAGFLATRHLLRPTKRPPTRATQTARSRLSGARDG